MIFGNYEITLLTPITKFRESDMSWDDVHGRLTTMVNFNTDIHLFENVSEFNSHRFTLYVRILGFGFELEKYKKR